MALTLGVNGRLISSRCRDGQLVQQALIGRHAYDGDCACSVRLDADTWNEMHVFPVSAAIDHKLDGFVEGEVTVKLRVKGVIVQSARLGVSTGN